GDDGGQTHVGPGQQQADGEAAGGRQHGQGGVGERPTRALLLLAARAAARAAAVVGALVQVQGHRLGLRPQVLRQGAVQGGQQAGAQVQRPRRQVGQQGLADRLVGGGVPHQDADGGQGGLPAGGQQQQRGQPPGRHGAFGVGQPQVLAQQAAGVGVDGA